MTSKTESLDGVVVKKEDQSRINKFARKNALLQELKDELKSKQDILQDIEEGENSMLLTQEQIIPYRVGEVFFELTNERTISMLEIAKKECLERISNLEVEIIEIEKILKDLKAELYARFGNNINLEPTAPNEI
ncbi:Prefoldin subunit 4-like [Oopsacas minuta]|uniref:Prefoldin subunit 4 n=1 Tax=Oopsacas minuta TaxID=111878 RepID=A0AAV7JHK8_9METZ|nr:Prefoldin subunit 4-like [Oopsacas minuta]